MVAKVFDEILLRGIRSGQVPARTQSAREWYREQAKKVSRSDINETTIMKESRDRYESKFLIGNMYMFVYNPKHKDTLPYYDRFPLVFPINRAKGGFLGINMHYLPHQLRATLMDALYEVVSNNRFDETTKIKASYSILNGASKYKEFQPTIKHYLSNHIVTNFVYINPTEWDIALWLPVEKFVGASRAKVWEDSKKIIRGNK